VLPSWVKQGKQVSGKTAGSASLIATPKGGGALHGLGETLSPDLHTGVASLTVLLALPSGRTV